MAKKVKSGEDRTATLSGVTMAALQREMARRARKAGQIARQRERLVAKIARLDAKIRELGGLVPGRVTRGRRSGGGGEGTLSGSLHALLNGKTMGVTEAADAVVASGYKTNAANFRTIVNACLIRHKNLFKKVGRGQYTAA